MIRAPIQSAAGCSPRPRRSSHTGQGAGDRLKVQWSGWRYRQSFGSSFRFGRFVWAIGVRYPFGRTGPLRTRRTESRTVIGLVVTHRTPSDASIGLRAMWENSRGSSSLLSDTETYFVIQCQLPAAEGVPTRRRSSTPTQPQQLGPTPLKYASSAPRDEGLVPPPRPRTTIAPRRSSARMSCRVD